jgi:secreted PhoX family phosphatase
MDPMDRRAFLSRGALVAGGLAIAGPLRAFAARAQMDAPASGEGYGPLVGMGELSLPEGFQYRIVSRQGDPMSDGNPTPGIFDGMAAYDGPRNTTILIRNHENRRRAGEIPVVAPDAKRYDSNPSYNAGNTKLIVAPDHRVVESYAVLGGTSTNCAGGVMPWGSWITAEEVFDAGNQPHGYLFEIDKEATGPVDPVPIKQAGRFSHEAVAWHGGVLYETEDRGDAALYRYVPSATPARPGDLAAGPGKLEALRITGRPGVNTKTGWPVGITFGVEWVGIEQPDPSGDTVRKEAQSKGAAVFSRTEGIWVGNDRVYFDCTDGGGAGLGQVWELNPASQELSLIYESPGAVQLKNPDNLVVAPTGDLLLCEDADAPQFLRGLTPEGQIYDFARANSLDSEFCGACFDLRGHTLFVNQQGGRPDPPAVTYAIWGPWERVSRS